VSVDWPFAIRVHGRGFSTGSVVLIGYDANAYLSPEQARAYAARIVQAADQAEHGIVPTIESESK